MRTGSSLKRMHIYVLQLLQLGQFLQPYLFLHLLQTAVVPAISSVAVCNFEGVAIAAIFGNAAIVAIVVHSVCSHKRHHHKRRLGIFRFFPPFC